MQFVGSMALLVFALGAWVLPGTGRPIAFSRPEVQFLFTAPGTRRGLLGFWLLGTQLIVLPAVIVALVVAAECWLATEVIGRVFERTDISSVDASE